jgi:hypothetical protein
MVGLLQADGSGTGLLKIGTFGIAANGGTATESIVDIGGAACDATQCLPQIRTVPITLGVPFTFILSATAQFNSATDRGSGDVELALQAFSVPDGCAVSSCQIAEMIEVVAPEPNAGGIALAGLAATLLGSIVRHR